MTSAVISVRERFMKASKPMASNRDDGEEICAMVQIARYARYCDAQAEIQERFPEIGKQHRRQQCQSREVNHAAPVKVVRAGIRRNATNQCPIENN